MTHEEFKAVCMKEFPLIESMVKTVRALGVQRISCEVSADGFINFSIKEKHGMTNHTAYHSGDANDGRLQITEYDHDGKSWWAPKCYYDHAIDDDSVEDDIPVQ